MSLLDCVAARMLPRTPTDPRTFGADIDSRNILPDGSTRRTGHVIVPGESVHQGVNAPINPLAVAPPVVLTPAGPSRTPVHVMDENLQLRSQLAEQERLLRQQADDLASIRSVTLALQQQLLVNPVPPLFTTPPHPATVFTTSSTPVFMSHATQPPIFDGDIDSAYTVDSFITYMQDYKLSSPAQMTDMQLMCVAASSFKVGSPARIWWETIPVPFPTFQAFASALRDRFQPANMDFIIRNQLTRLTCENYNVPAYATKFQQLLSRLTSVQCSLSEYDAKYEFTKGLPKSLRTRKPLRSVTLEELINESISKYAAGHIYSKMESKFSPQQSGYGRGSSGNQSRFNSRPQQHYHEFDAEADDSGLVDYENDEFDDSEFFDAPLYDNSEAELAAFGQSGRGQNPSFRGRGSDRGRGRGRRTSNSSRKIIPHGMDPKEYHRRFKSFKCLRCGQDGHNAVGCLAPKPVLQAPSNPNA